MVTSVKDILKQLVLLTYPLSIVLDRLGVWRRKPFMCFITPVFDGSFTAMKELMAETRVQSCRSFIHVLISNGPSPLTRRYVREVAKHDPRYIYIELPHKPTRDGVELLRNLGERRNYAMENYKAYRYVIADADSELIDRHYIAKLIPFHIVTEKDIIMTRTFCGRKILPRPPYYIGDIDLTNITFSRYIAQLGWYPTEPDPRFEHSYDCRFLRKINMPGNMAFAPINGFRKNSRQGYQSAATFFQKTTGHIFWQGIYKKTWTLIGLGKGVNEIIEAIESRRGRVSHIILDGTEDAKYMRLLPKHIIVQSLDEFLPLTARYFYGFLDGDKKAVEKLLLRHGIIVANVVHKEAGIDNDAQLGKGQYIGPRKTQPIAY
jgi:hypothetical protein